MTTSTLPLIGKEKPRVVAKAVHLLFAGIVVSFLDFILMCQVLLWVDVFGSFLVFMMRCLFFAFLILKINDGRNWARKVFLILYLLGIPFFLHSLINWFSVSLAISAVSLVQFAMDGIALVMLFSRDAAPWFRSSEPNSSGIVATNKGADSNKTDMI